MAKSIMIQGTMSNAGKSVLVGGLCRVLKQDGYRVAPFKSQNMALNSFITEDGLEMGRAQVMQAEAAGIKPDVNMNPILLKPTNDVGSQVIVNGRVTGTMSAVEYYKHKREYVPEIMKAYQKLEEDYDIIVIEGAGSPAEINLKSEDIVNMGMAKMVDAPVLLVGDIDRGGVFAQIVGTIMLLEEDEKRRIKGTIINKFRGDKAILQPGLDMLEEKTGIPVAGVMPYFYLEIDDEDSLSERFVKKDTVGLIDIAIMKLPRISNFTDFTALECMPEVSVRYVTTAGEFGNPDVVILPGTKNTIGDLLWMRQSGIEAKILQHAASGKVVFGICGGYQMLGENISDPHHAESEADEVRGIGLLPIETVFSKEKTRTRVHGTFAQVKGSLSEMSGAAFDGYEIHMGETKLTGEVDHLMHLAVDAGGKQDDEHSEKAQKDEIRKSDESDTTGHVFRQDGTSYGNVYGCYIHGVFDEPEVTRGFVSSLLKQKGISDVNVEGINLAAFKEEQYNKLADIVRANLDMKAIYEIIEKGNN